MGIPLCVICCFSLAVFNICSLGLIFVSLIIMCLCVCVSPWVYPVWDSLGFLDLGGYFLPHFREVFDYLYSNIFSCPFLLSSSSATPIIQVLGCFNLIVDVSETVLIYFYSSFFHSVAFISTILSSRSLILLPQLLCCLFPPECF